jgi:hypothetical protein
MGLDNIPAEYPCQSQNVAITVKSDEREVIDCVQTIGEGKCPWQNSFNEEKMNNPFLKDSTPAYGMLGTNCWYRGKYGNYLLGILTRHCEDAQPPCDFYGEGLENENGDEGISPEMCLSLSEFMTNNIENFTYAAMRYAEESNEELEYAKTLVSDYAYAAWWLKFVAKQAGGSRVWY